MKQNLKLVKILIIINIENKKDVPDVLKDKRKVCKVIIVNIEYKETAVIAQ